MTKLEKFILAKLIIRQINHLQNQDIFYHYVMPLMTSLMGNKMTASKIVDRLLEDWKEEVRDFMLKNN